MVEECFKKWNIETSLPENSDYKKIINRVKRMKNS